MKEGNLKDFDLCLIEMLLNPEKHKKIIQIIREKLPHGEELDNLSEYIKHVDTRLKSVFEHAKQKGCPIMVDAEQTYLQSFIDYLVSYYFKIYNKNECIVFNTLQCYLKKHEKSMAKWYRFSEEHDLRMGMKLVRGAYMTEEGRLAKSIGLPSTVCENIDQTHINYNNSIKHIFENYRPGDKVYNNP